MKARCRCYINASYNSKTAWRTGKLPKPCPVPGHDEDLKELEDLREYFSPALAIPFQERTFDSFAVPPDQEDMDGPRLKVQDTNA